MIETVLEKLARFVQYLYIPKFRKLERKIGYKLIFRDIPSDYINGWMSCDMTQTWQNFGLDVVAGANYWTVGKIIDGESSRFDPNSLEYQSWMGGYTVKLVPKVIWTPEDHFKLAIADQNSWLKHYGDPRPLTSTRGWSFTEAGKIQIGPYSGQLYEFGCTTHDDIGRGYRAMKLRLASLWMAASFNLSNPNLKLMGYEFMPRKSDNLYRKLKLIGYMAIFEITENVKVVLYANGFIDEEKHVDTFTVLKDDLLNAMRSCEILTL